MDDAPFVTREYLEARLRSAGIVLLSMPERTKPGGYKTAWPEIVHSVFEAYGWHAEKTKFPVPSARAVMEMGEVLDWLRLIDGQDRYIVSARMLWHPLRDRPVLSWRRIGANLGLGKDTIRRLHDAAVDQLLSKINGLKKS